MLSAHNLPKLRDERCVPRAWDAYLPPCSFAPQDLSVGDVVSPTVEVEMLGGRFCSVDEPGVGSPRAVAERWVRSTTTATDNGLNPSWDEAFRVAVLSPAAVA